MGATSLYKESHSLYKKAAHLPGGTALLPEGGPFLYKEGAGLYKEASPVALAASRLYRTAAKILGRAPSPLREEASLYKMLPELYRNAAAERSPEARDPGAKAERPDCPLAPGEEGDCSLKAPLREEKGWNEVVDVARILFLQPLTHI